MDAFGTGTLILGHGETTKKIMYSKITSAIQNNIVPIIITTYYAHYSGNSIRFPMDDTARAAYLKFQPDIIIISDLERFYQLTNFKRFTVIDFKKWLTEEELKKITSFVNMLEGPYHLIFDHPMFDMLCETGLRPRLSYTARARGLRNCHYEMYCQLLPDIEEIWITEVHAIQGIQYCDANLLKYYNQRLRPLLLLEDEMTKLFQGGRLILGFKANSDDFFIEWKQRYKRLI